MVKCLFTPSTKFPCNFLLGKPTGVQGGPHWMVTVDIVKYYSWLNDLTHRLKPDSLLQVTLFTFSLLSGGGRLVS